MLNFSKTRIFFISLACFLAIYFSLPTFLPSFSAFKEGGVHEKFLPKSKVNLGLDLQGGSQLSLEVDFEYYLKEQLKNLSSEIKNSFREEAISAIPEEVGNKIRVILSDQDQADAAKKLIRKISKDVEVESSDNVLEVFFSDEKLSKIRQNLISQSIEIIRRRIDENGTKEPSLQAQGDNRILLQVPGLQNSGELKAALGKTAKMTFQFVDESAFSGQGSLSGDVEMIPDDLGRMYPIKKEVVLSGDLLVDANPSYHEGQPAVTFKFNDIGARKFAQITEANIGRIFAIILDGKVVTAPRINSIINQGSGVISGSFTVEEAAEVALLLRAGALPAPLKVVEERTVGPSLGLDSIQNGKISVIAGLVFVALFMVLFYGNFGMIANLALVINLAMIISGLAIIGANLTLPGIAGIVLTMGMSVDANVLIFERIKEELRQKKTVLQAVEQGFSQAFRTITDSNITTLIVAFFLYAFGNGSIKGFAVTLAIGILASMFSAIVLVRMIVAVWLKKKRPKKLSLI